MLAILVLAFATRFYRLGDRPLHHDESIHAYQSYTLSQNGEWRYDPAYHGPFLYYANAVVYKIFGASNTTARLLPAFFGVLLIALRLAPAPLDRRRRGPRVRPARAALAAPRVLLPIHPRGPLFARLHARDDPRLPAVPRDRPGAVADRLRRLLRPGRRDEGERLHDGRPLRRVRALDPRRAHRSSGGPGPAPCRRRSAWVRAHLAALVTAGDRLPLPLGAPLLGLRPLSGRLARDPQGGQVLDGPARDRAHPGALVLLLPAAALLRDGHGPGRRLRVPRMEAQPLPRLRRLLGRRVARNLRLGAREGSLADRAPPAAPDGPRRDRPGQPLAGPPPDAAAPGAAGHRRPARGQRERDAPRLLPLRRLRPRAGAQARRVPRLRPDDGRPGPGARASSTRSGRALPRGSR